MPYYFYQKYIAIYLVDTIGHILSAVNIFIFQPQKNQQLRFSDLQVIYDDETNGQLVSGLTQFLCSFPSIHANVAEENSSIIIAFECIT